MSRLWEKGTELNAKVHEFTVGNDPVLDLCLIRWDIIASAAHVRMLKTINLLSADEEKAVLTALSELLAECDAGSFVIDPQLEDCHTAIESYLVEKLGDVGKKVHTGRSRNDQVLVAMRLWMKNEIFQITANLSNCAEQLLGRYKKEKDIPMPGYTHFQAAMPSSVGMLLHGYAETLLDSVKNGLALAELIDKNPLGAAAGFGAPFSLDRKLTADLLGFSEVQRNPIAVQNSRGRYELRYLRWLSDIAAFVEKFSWDLILYSSESHGFFSLPEELTTGSSIMPQKKNPDVLELLRGRAAKVRGAEHELAWVIAKLPSHYHRDFQYTKEPVFKASVQVSEMIAVLAQVIDSFVVNKDALEKAMSAELYATYDAYRAVREGVPFRDAYQQTAEKVAKNQINKAELEGDFKIIADAVDEEAKAAAKELDQLQSGVATSLKNIEQIEQQIFIL